MAQEVGSSTSSSLPESLVAPVVASTALTSVSTSSPSPVATEQGNEDIHEEEQSTEPEQVSSWIGTVGNVVEGMVDEG